jgi:hypothetical protein
MVSLPHNTADVTSVDDTASPTLGNESEKYVNTAESSHNCGWCGRKYNGSGLSV